MAPIAGQYSKCGREELALFGTSGRKVNENQL